MRYPAIKRVQSGLAVIRKQDDDCLQLASLYLSPLACLPPPAHQGKQTRYGISVFSLLKRVQMKSTSRRVNSLNGIC